MGNLTLEQAKDQLNDLAKQWAQDKALGAFDPEGAKQDLLRLVNDMDIHATGFYHGCSAKPLMSVASRNG